VTFNHKNVELSRRKFFIVERENAFIKSSPVDEYHLPQMNSEKVLFWVQETAFRGTIFHYRKSKFPSNFSSAEGWKSYFLVINLKCTSNMKN
jgi:hypothetical protein